MKLGAQFVKKSVYSTSNMYFISTELKYLAEDDFLNKSDYIQKKKIVGS